MSSQVRGRDGNSEKGFKLCPRIGESEARVDLGMGGASIFVGSGVHNPGCVGCLCEVRGCGLW